MDNTVTKLMKNEIDEIELYFEKINSLKGLCLAFESDEIFNKNSLMYERLVQDLSKSNNEFTDWWNKIIIKYNLQKINREKMYVDFLSEEIRLK